MAKRQLHALEIQEEERRPQEEAREAEIRQLKQQLVEVEDARRAATRDHVASLAVKESEVVRLRAEAACLRKEVTLLSASVRNVERELASCKRGRSRAEQEAAQQLHIEQEATRLAKAARDKAFLEAERARGRERAAQSEREREGRERDRAEATRRERERLERESLDKAHDRERIGAARELRELQGTVARLGTEAEVAVQRLREVTAEKEQADRRADESERQIEQLRHTLDERDRSHTADLEQWRVDRQRWEQEAHDEPPVSTPAAAPETGLSPPNRHVETVEEAALKLHVRRWEEWAQGVAGLVSDVVCPIALEPMRDPQVASDGVSYERAEMQRWLRFNDRSPATNMRLRSIILYPNVALKSLVASLGERLANLPKASA